MRSLHYRILLVVITLAIAASAAAQVPQYVDLSHGVMKIYTDLGVRLILSGSDFAFMMNGAKAQSAAVRGLV